MDLWIARDEVDNALFIYDGKPRKDVKSGMFICNPGRGCMIMPKDSYPGITWENSPKRLLVAGIETVYDELQ